MPTSRTNRKKPLSRGHFARPFLGKTMRWMLLALSIITLYHLALHYAEPKLFPVKHVQLEATFERIDAVALKQQIMPHVKGFFSTDVMALKRRLQSLPFVDKVTIKRVWPDTLTFTLTELTFIATWNNDAAVTSGGDIMPVTLNPDKHLPHFMGPPNQVATVLNQYKVLSAMLEPLHLTIAAITLNLRDSWQLILTNGIKISLGRKDIARHLAAFVTIYPTLKKLHGKAIKSIDLRYSNGVSVDLYTSQSDCQDYYAHSA